MNDTRMQYNGFIISVANSLWNNMLERVGQKSTDGNDILAKFNCPTAEDPYIFTKRNSFNRF